MKTDLHVSAKACIVRNDKLLLVQYRDIGEVGVHYNLPGGRLLPNETLHEGCKRKALLEAGAIVAPRELLFVYEYIGKNHDFAAGDKHSVSLIFRCELLPGSEPSMETCAQPDTIQTDVCWIPIDDLPSIELFPRVQSRLHQALRNGFEPSGCYWGDIL